MNEKKTTTSRPERTTTECSCNKQNKNHYFTVLKSLCKYGAVVVVLWKFVDFENRQRRKIFVKITELIKLQ